MNQKEKKLFQLVHAIKQRGTDVEGILQRAESSAELSHLEKRDDMESLYP